MSSSSASRLDVLACGALQVDVFWCNRLNFLDLGAISLHIACVSLGRRYKDIAFPWSESVFLNGAIGNACCRNIVTVNGGWCLWVA